MADELRIGLQELLRKARMEHDAHLLKEGVRVLSQALMEMEGGDVRDVCHPDLVYLRGREAPLQKILGGNGSPAPRGGALPTNWTGKLVFSASMSL